MSPSTSCLTLDSPISTITPSTQPAPPIVPTATDGSNTPTMHEDQGPMMSGAPKDYLKPTKTPVPTTPPVLLLEDANIQTQEEPAPHPNSAGTNDDTWMMDTMASTPDQASEGALSTATNGIPAKPGPQCKSTNTTDNVPMTLMDTVRMAPMPGAVLTGDALEATSKTDKSTSKTKIKKAGIMCPGKSTTASDMQQVCEDMKQVGQRYLHNIYLVQTQGDEEENYWLNASLKTSLEPQLNW
ncbi:hypothetical protein H4582DRAFT_2058671 [Lactarius indigo]|nr:hypothetical protein H4582DRAFT_2065852 [Lactarius indigo]KAI9429357.1 hypothetical protein H4582DRAFT_2065379 [Lactarius indigo]KAI9429670.1 hypothetical protein H4582DRAFT_2064937 [Lactarius indigo]KAI9436760.1 hypothetical protein H4582DRAFT_2058671 [Lactarius indigo]